MEAGERCSECGRSELLSWELVERLCRMEHDLTVQELLEQSTRNGELLASDRYLRILAAIRG